MVADFSGVCNEKLKSATIALIFPCHQHNAREMWAKYRLAQARLLKNGVCSIHVDLSALEDDREPDPRSW